MSFDSVTNTNVPVQSELEKYLLRACPCTIYYIPEFVTPDEEAALLRNVYAAPKPKWTQLSHRRLQNWGGIPHTNGMIAEKIPKWLQDCIDKVSNLEVFSSKLPNHVLVNEYEAGQGIMPHLDGPLFYPTITTVSLGSHTCLDFFNQSTKSEKPDFTLFVAPRSLLILQDSAYTDYLHGIAERTSDTIDHVIANTEEAGVRVGEIVERKTRISLTIRHVPKTSKLRIQLRPKN